MDTFHQQDDLVPDMSVEDCKDWIMDWLGDEGKRVDDAPPIIPIGDPYEGEKENGLNNITRFARAFEELEEEGKIREIDGVIYKFKGGDEDMSKVKVKKPFSYEEKNFEEGKEYEIGEGIPKKLAEKAIDEDRAIKIEDLGEESEEEEEDEIELEVEEPEVETVMGDEPDDIFDSMDEDFEQSGTLPPRWNAKASSNKVEELDREPPVNPLKGEVVQTGKAQYGPFVVIKEKGSNDEYTIFDQTALKAFVHTAKKVYDPNEKLYAGVRFDGIMEKEGGRNYLAYSATLRNEEGEKIRLQEPEEEEE